MSFNDIKQEPNIIIESFYLRVVFKSILKDLGGLKYWRFARNTLSETKIQNLHP